VPRPCECDLLHLVERDGSVQQDDAAPSLPSMPTTAAAIAATIAGAASVCSEWYRKLQLTAHTLSFLAPFFLFSF